jgi:hypothetical protein
MRCLVVAVVLTACWFSAPLSAAEPLLTLSKPVEMPVLSEEALIAIPLDADVYAATQDDLDDVRILDAEGQPVPYLLRKLQSTRSRTERTTWSAPNVSVKPLQTGGIEITIRRDDDDKRPAPTGITLHTPLDNFEQRVRVETSTDGVTWEPAAESVIFDYSRYMDVRNIDALFPETDRRHFRVTIDDVTAEQESELIELTRRLQGDEETERTERFVVDRRPFRIDRIEFIHEVQRPQSAGDVHSGYPVASFTVEESAEEKQSIITVETRREPLTSFTIETPSRNFSRRVEVQIEHVEGVRREWRPIGENTLSRIDFGSQHREELKISFPETRQTTYRILIDNRDSPPLKIEGIAPEGIVYEAVIFAEPAGQYTLAYADEKATAPEYDVAALQTLLNTGVPPQRATLGTEQPTPAAGQPRPIAWADLLNNPALLISLVVVLVIALGWGLYHAVKRVDSLPKDGNA